MNTPIVAADTNLLLHPTPRRYVTVLEGLGDRPITVLPTVAVKTRRRLPIKASEFVEELSQEKTTRNAAAVEAARNNAAIAARRWWESERTSNFSCYAFVRDLGEEEYIRWMSKTPSHAFTGRNDRWIYAEAMAHDIGIIASESLATIHHEVLENHFLVQGKTPPPITIRTLLEHTVAITNAEGRDARDAVLEAALCATVPEQWGTVTHDAMRAMSSAFSFKKNLTAEGNDGRYDQLGPLPRERDALARLLHGALKRMLSDADEQDITHKLDTIHAMRPLAARWSEARYPHVTRMGRHQPNEGIGA